MDCKATVELGEYSRGGQTRGNNLAQDHDLGVKEKYIPCEFLMRIRGNFILTLVVLTKPVISW